jgi:hypothetical protein
MCMRCTFMCCSDEQPPPNIVSVTNETISILQVCVCVCRSLTVTVRTARRAGCARTHRTLPSELTYRHTAVADVCPCAHSCSMWPRAPPALCECCVYAHAVNLCDCASSTCQWCCAVEQCRQCDCRHASCDVSSALCACYVSSHAHSATEKYAGFVPDNVNDAVQPRSVCVRVCFD